ncbi:hypothetical protein ES707_12598 [subsurface metagenome]
MLGRRSKHKYTKVKAEAQKAQKYAMSKDTLLNLAVVFV